jgi:hypothetical protein
MSLAGPARLVPLAQRWKAGLLDMDYAMDLKCDDDFVAVRRK